MKNKYTRHHKIAKSRWGSNHYDNIIMLKDLQHRAFHTIFANQLPHEQIETILDINWCALTNEFKFQVQDVINEFLLEEMFNRKCIVSQILNPNN